MENLLGEAVPIVNCPACKQPCEDPFAIVLFKDQIVLRCTICLPCHATYLYEFRLRPITAESFQELTGEDGSRFVTEVEHLFTEARAAKVIH